MGSIALLILAAILGVVSYKVLAVRFGLRWYWIGKFCAALAVALVIFVITLNLAGPALEKAWSDRGWAQYDWIRPAFILALTVIGGLWAYFAYRDRNPDG